LDQQEAETKVDETQLRLDGNAAAGILREVFVHEVSAAQGACAGCGKVAAMGSHHLYRYPLSPGAVLRCSSCDSVLIVVVHARGRYRLGLAGLTWLDMSDPAEAAAEP
jgi:Family of unknown function (DUF6510)